MPELTTFSIVARCPRTGDLGVAVATAVPAVGGLCPFVASGVGAVSTQSWVNPYLAIDALAAMAGGASGPDALAAVLGDDAGRALRQVGVVDAAGRAASHTGADCTPYAGHRLGDGMAVQGNMLTGPETLDAMARAFADAAEADLPERLMRALEAGDAAGGDKRGKQSAALKIHGTEAYPSLDLRVDEHAAPVTELRRVLEIARHQLVPFVAGMPRRGQPAAGLPADTAAMLLRPPPGRPGGGGSLPEPRA
ncbi:hypothetical protein OPKNFCMD_6498 [Methylobacterium crusticola]|uniref:DUF1028 domain-containing protein n=1 Tax=Methylobacterium crusticola TaxID=1697972 RepID=A0ABQ4R984_9HYPH|nr:DUF1028 domain-containing protein [Methylobacterium crusticola]GJD53720.1 hypothetical protein OPKNFCMD_6498 [Methylobacterium crusticola]